MVSKRREYYQKRKRWHRIRKRMSSLVYKRDGHKCSHCNSTEHLTIDHIVPLSRGGKVKDLNNLQVLCAECNNKKGSNALFDNPKRT